MAEQDLSVRFDELVEAIIAGEAEPGAPGEAGLTALWRTAVDLLDLPSAGFRERVMADLDRRAASMKQTTVTPFVPAGFRTLTAYLIVSAADRLIDFAKQVFGAEPVLIRRQPDGSVQHPELRIGDSMLELSDGSPAWPARPAAIHVYLPDRRGVRARAGCRRALAAGADRHALRRPRGGRDRPVREQLVHRDAARGRPGAAGHGHPHSDPARQGDRPADRVHPAGLRRPGARPRAGAGRHRYPRGAQARRLGPGARRGARLRPADAVRDPLLRGGRGPCLRERAGGGRHGAGCAVDRPYGDRAAEVQDPFGNHWFLARQIDDRRGR